MSHSVPSIITYTKLARNSDTNIALFDVWDIIAFSIYSIRRSIHTGVAFQASTHRELTWRLQTKDTDAEIKS
ncbi:hypothetical protein HETIRDRAFT_385876 [Heterobasidion irregulare TC 32-1]|uniref:Uncharacterized protein n=1 Tax=Heterobasidion irregulare (strain TC 32-1) TaxID=747525 RepID=W4K5Q9_HETIT|nr:uncharacterized protein HETIRDRAFT_385876 [Heterobasidion irregulare TC 32-1]ETW81142.1 hypothetical protein HETIRDRAFT_385876 [Heterobasidion irregulare TC 32-1]